MTRSLKARHCLSFSRNRITMIGFDSLKHKFKALSYGSRHVWRLAQVIDQEAVRTLIRRSRQFEQPLLGFPQKTMISNPDLDRIYVLLRSHN
jgi:hypothetical protein